MVETNIANSQPVSDEYLEKMNAYWRAANYLGAAQLYLLDNPLLREPLTMEHVKKKIVGHWGTVPGQNFVYVHLNRVIKKYDQEYDFNFRSWTWWKFLCSKYIFGGYLQRSLSEYR